MKKFEQVFGIISVIVMTVMGIVALVQGIIHNELKKIIVGSMLIGLFLILLIFFLILDFGIKFKNKKHLKEIKLLK